MKNRLFFKASSVFFVLLMVLMQVGISCQKDDNNQDTQDCSVSMKGMAGVYMLTKVEAQLPTVPTFTDITSTVLADNCMKDNTLTLSESGTASYDDKGVVCTPSSSTSGTWSLSGQQMTLNLAQSPINLSTATVNSYDCKTLVVTGSGPVPGTQIRATLSKQ